MDTTKEHTEMKTYCAPQIERMEIDNVFSLFSPLFINSERDPKLSIYIGLL